MTDSSLQAQLGAQPNLLAAGADSCRRIVLPFPVLGNDELTKIVRVMAVQYREAVGPWSAYLRVVRPE